MLRGASDAAAHDNVNLARRGRAGQWQRAVRPVNSVHALHEPGTAPGARDPAPGAGREPGGFNDL